MMLPHTQHFHFHQFIPYFLMELNDENAEEVRRALVGYSEGKSYHLFKPFAGYGSATRTNGL